MAWGGLGNQMGAYSAGKGHYGLICGYFGADLRSGGGFLLVHSAVCARSVAAWLMALRELLSCRA